MEMRHRQLRPLTLASFPTRASASSPALKDALSTSSKHLGRSSALRGVDPLGGYPPMRNNKTRRRGKGQAASAASTSQLHGPSTASTTLIGRHYTTVERPESEKALLQQQRTRRTSQGKESLPPLPREVEQRLKAKLAAPEDISLWEDDVHSMLAKPLDASALVSQDLRHTLPGASLRFEEGMPSIPGALSTIDDAYYEDDAFSIGSFMEPSQPLFPYSSLAHTAASTINNACRRYGSFLPSFAHPWVFIYFHVSLPCQVHCKATPRCNAHAGMVQCCCSCGAALPLYRFFMQSLFRGYYARKELRRIVATVGSAAAKIQALIRGVQTRNWIRRLKWLQGSMAAVRFQALWRGVQGR